MSWIKNILLLATSSVLTIIVCNFLVHIYLEHYKNSKPWILESEEIKFYRKYENQVNHLRNPNLKFKSPHLYKSTEDLMFSRLSEENVSNSILITGDSWGERFAFDTTSYQKLKNHALNNKVSFTLSGTTSYSPTLLGIQSRILKEDFNLSFSEAFIVVDNTDIGDELCRYRRFIGKNYNGDKVVYRFSADDKMKTYMNDTFLYVSEVLSLDDYALLKLAKLIMRKIRTRLVKSTECGWAEISKYFYKMSESEIQYFETTVEFMIKEIKRNNPNVTIHILTIPHRKHVTGEYKNSTEKLIRKVLDDNNYSNVNLVDFSEKINELLTSGSSLDDIFIIGDRASHLTSFGHNALLVPFITTATRRGMY
tara:strand:- start:2088 stop:3185 length:1098 start_codon:yes stop_codon:yes gene_type:complete